MDNKELERKEEIQTDTQETPTENLLESRNDDCQESAQEFATKETPVQNTKSEKKKPWVKRHKKLLIFLGVLSVIGLAIGIAAIARGAAGIKALGDFVTDQILGMKWLNMLLGLAFTGMFGAEFMGSIWGGAIQFFIYDTIKIILLLCILIFLISYIQSYFPPERTKQLLGRFHGVGANAMGALLGTITPFCSCSSIPIFMGFSRAGLSSGVTFSFINIKSAC